MTRPQSGSYLFIDLDELSLEPPPKEESIFATIVVHVKSRCELMLRKNYVLTFQFDSLRPWCTLTSFSMIVQVYLWELTDSESGTDPVAGQRFIEKKYEGG